MLQCNFIGGVFIFKRTLGVYANVHAHPNGSLPRMWCRQSSDTSITKSFLVSAAFYQEIFRSFHHPHVNETVKVL